jgi:hypothetical protein
MDKGCCIIQWLWLEGMCRMLLCSNVVRPVCAHSWLCLVSCCQSTLLCASCQTLCASVLSALDLPRFSPMSPGTVPPAQHSSWNSIHITSAEPQLLLTIHATIQAGA